MSRGPKLRRPSRATAAGLVLVALSFVVYWVGGKDFDAGRGDFFYLADAFLHGRTWLDFAPGPFDVIPLDGRYYVPFAPFPAIVLMPLVALVGPVAADQWESGVNAALAAASVGACWWLLGRLGVPRLRDRFWLTLLFGFSTQILWVAIRGGVWHTGQLLAAILTFACLIELWGRKRPLLIGLLAGAAFLTRAPLAFAVPFYLLLLEPDVRLTAVRNWPVRAWTLLVVGVLPSIAFFLWYNAVRFGSPLESGYALALLPDWLAAQRQVGLFSLAHVRMNVDYMFLRLPALIPDPPFFKPDGFGMSVFFTSPGLLYAIRAPWRDPSALLLLGGAVLVLIPTLLYYGGGWLQYGYRYFLDSIPFLAALCGMAAANRRRIGRGWIVLILWGVAVMSAAFYWVSRL